MNIIMMHNSGKNSVFNNGKANGNVVFVSSALKEIMEEDSDDSMYVCRINIQSEPDEKTGKHVSLEVRRSYPSSVEDYLGSSHTFFYSVDGPEGKIEKDEDPE